ncbi:MAG TPA: hypothetical protein VK435_11400, partial [Thermodesulfovibrionales bacterium]|nr:hypothetical protein [Thermodesulfovibrionales bacterium]
MGEVDKSEEYYRRCLEASEIQNEWNLNDGDFFARGRARETSHKALVLNDWETRYDIVAHRECGCRDW